MTCHNCRTECQKYGKDRKGHQRYRCQQCSKSFLEPREKPLDNMYLPIEKAEKILALMVEGMSVRAIERVTEVHRDTILRLLVLAGERCEKLLTEKISRFRATDVQCDEIWGYVGKKERSRWPHEAHDAGIGDAWCFVAIDRKTKLVVTWHLGKRTRTATTQFVRKLADATNHRERFQLTTDGFKPYLPAIEYILGDRVRFAQLVKVYASSREAEHRYSPPDVVEAVPTPIYGDPDLNKICTSHVERQNLTMRMHMRRLTRLTNGFSKKWENLRAALALHFAWYNFVRVHSSLRVTPAMQAGITDHIWTLEDLLGV